MSTDYSDPVLRTRKILIGIDFGTSKSSVAFTIDPRPARDRARILPLGKIALRDLRVVQFDGEDQVSTQIAWNVKDQQWVCGADVDEQVESGDIPESSRILSIKLCLEQSSLTESIRKRVKSQFDQLPPAAIEELGPEDVPWAERLVGLYLRYLWKHARRNIASAYYCSHEGEDVFVGREVEIWIGVPK